jgi:DHA2 family multidrug resistance protein
MPIAGWLIARGVDARWMILGALVIVSGALYWMTGLTLEVSQGYLIMLRIVQTFALGFFFVPIQSAAYLYLPKQQINNATGMVSMLRNEGASLGVAVLTTILTQRSQVHQVYLGAHINLTNHATVQALARAAELAHRAGADPELARHQALGLLYNLLQQQSTLMAYLDAFMAFSLMALAVIPLILLMRRSAAKDAPLSIT